MTASTQRADLPIPSFEEEEPLVLDHPADPAFDPGEWRAAEARNEFRGAGGRKVLGIALGILAALWLAFTAWSAGRALAAEPLSSPALAQWVAIAAGPLALLGLAWLMFGRTRRREAERFTQSVIAMRTEAESLQALLTILSEKIERNRSDLSSMATGLMSLGEETAGKLGGITRELDQSASGLARHGEALDRAAESARNDIAVLLDDLPRAEAVTRTMAEQLRGSGAEAIGRAADLERQIESLARQARESETIATEASERLTTELGRVESAGAAAAEKVGAAEQSFAEVMDLLLNRTADTLSQIRTGVDSQSAAVAALVDQAKSGLGRAGGDAAEALGASVAGTQAALDRLSSQLAEQERASQRLAAEAERSLSALDQQFAVLADQGDQRAAAFVEAIGRARSEMDLLAQSSGDQQGSIAALADRTESLRAAVDRLTGQVRGEFSDAMGDAESKAGRLLDAARSARPELEWMREAATEASRKIAVSADGLAEQQDQFAAFLASLEDGVSGAETRLSSLTADIATAQEEAARLSNETGAQLVASMVQVREAAAQAAERAREAIEAVIPQSAARLSTETRDALERVVRESVEEQLRSVEATATRAVEAARAASDRLTQQMLNLGQSANALEQHMEQTSAAQRERDSEAFARRVSLLIDSMHSASIDVGKILSDEVDERAWESYLKGDRGVFTRRAVRLVDGTESKAILAHYDGEPEFQESVNRYVHDFEAMLRRVTAERDGGPIAVTLMSSDMGKLYAALAQAIDRRR